MPDRTHIIVSGRHGRIDGPDIAHEAALHRLLAADDLVIHVHGGLVSEQSGTAGARRLAAAYAPSGAASLFVVWQSGLLEVLRHNLGDILREEFFERLLRAVIGFVVGKLRQDPDTRGALALPVRSEVVAQLRRRDEDDEPYAEMSASQEVTAVDAVEQRRIEGAVQVDVPLIAALNAVVASARPPGVAEDERGVPGGNQGSTASAVDPTVLDELAPQDAGERGLVSTLVLARKCVAATIRSVGRFRDRTDHGVYPTVVEELLREFYLGNAGAALWSAMKEQTRATFGGDAGDPTRAGRLIVDSLASGPRGSLPRITLVGHSAGSIFINHLLQDVARRRAAGSPWPDTELRTVLLAPACTHAALDRTLRETDGLVRAWHMFTMDDRHETRDRLVGALYPRSLLFLVSGLLERDDHGRSRVVPLLGLARHLDRPAASATRVALGADGVVLSPSAPDAPRGRRSAALSHGAFDDDPDTLDSIVALVTRR